MSDLATDWETVHAPGRDALSGGQENRRPPVCGSRRPRVEGGRRPADSCVDLLGLRFGQRLNQVAGELVVDFQWHRLVLADALCRVPGAQCLVRCLVLRAWC